MGNIHSIKQRTLVGLAMAAAVCAFPAGAASAGLQEVSTVNPGDAGVRADVPRDRHAEAEALARDEGISAVAAARKLDWQGRAAEFIDRSRAAAPSGFGGAWLEGDAVHVWVKSRGDSNTEERLQALAVDTAVGSIETRPGSYSESELTALQAVIDRSLAVVNIGAPSTVDVEPDVKQNRLVLRVPLSPTAVQRGLVDKLSAAYAGELAVGVKGVVSRLACNGPWCDPPLRGGTGLVYGSSHLCTAGFVMQSASDSKRYLTTQTHCIAGGNTGTWESRFSNDGHHNIGAVHNWDNSDRAILNIDNPGGWSPGPYLRIAGNETYAVTGASIPAVGARTCTSGSHSWGENHCGTVSYGLATRDGVTNTLRAQLDDCPVPGDSGAPFYSYGVAHGTLIGVYGNTGCGGVWFSSLNNLLASLNVRILVQG